MKLEAAARGGAGADAQAVRPDDRRRRACSRSATSGGPAAAMPRSRSASSRCAAPRTCSTGTASRSSTRPSARSRRSRAASSTARASSAACGRNDTQAASPRPSRKRQNRVLYSADVARPPLHHVLARAAGEFREPDVALRKQLPAPACACGRRAPSCGQPGVEHRRRLRSAPRGAGTRPVHVDGAAHLPVRGAGEHRRRSRPGVARLP